MKISNLISPELIFFDIDYQDRQKTVKSIVNNLCNVEKSLNNSTTVESILKREELCSTALDNYIAIPHAKISGISKTYASMTICKEGTDFGSVDELKTKIFVLILHPENTDNNHLEILRSVANIFAKKSIVDEILSLEDKNLIYQIIQTHE